MTLASGQADPVGIAVDGTSVYWGTQGTTGGEGGVFKVPICGGTMTALASQTHPAALAVDSKSVYWANSAQGTATFAMVQMVPLGGGGVTTLVSGTIGGANGLALTSADLVFTGAGPGQGNGVNVSTAPIGGGSETPLARNQFFTAAIATDGTTVFWTTGDGKLFSVPLGGGTVATLADTCANCGNGGASVCGLAIDANDVYWTSTTPSGSALMKMARSGGTPTTLATGGGGVAVDATSVYLANSGAPGQGNGSIVKIPLAGGSPTTMASAQASPQCIAVDASNVYWTNLGSGAGGDGAVMQMPK